jgi:hypothetical protein
MRWKPVDRLGLLPILRETVHRIPRSQSLTRTSFAISESFELTENLLERVIGFEPTTLCLASSYARPIESRLVSGFPLGEKRFQHSGVSLLLSGFQPFPAWNRDQNRDQLSMQSRHRAEQEPSIPAGSSSGRRPGRPSSPWCGPA